jgi:putative sigma-54 modulation protein
MKVQVHSIHFVADRKLLDFIQQRVNKLETIYSRIVSGEVFLRLNNEGIENKTVEIRVNVPGNQVFAKERGRTFEAAAQLAADALKQQLAKIKTRITRGRS